MDRPDGAGAARSLRRRRRRRRGARDHRHGRRARLLRRRRPRGRRRHLRLQQARHGGRGRARQRRPVHAARLRIDEARDRCDQRPGGRDRGDDDAADGRPSRRRRRTHRLRLRPPRDHPGGRFELVPAACRGHQPGDGMGRHRARLRRAGGPRTRPSAQPAPESRAARRGARPGARDRGQHGSCVGRARAAADVADARSRAPDVRAPRGLARDGRAWAVRGRGRGRHRRSWRSARRRSPTR